MGCRELFSHSFGPMTGRDCQNKPACRCVDRAVTRASQRGNVWKKKAGSISRPSVESHLKTERQIQQENTDSLHSFSTLVGIINKMSIPPYFNPAGCRSQPDHTTESSAVETRAVAAPQHQQYGR
ncbi:hypothetical protein CHARACLAT_030834, partial [Characodon lateralis]|nr:hypothetical protein [Characodon lateralis]